METEFFMPMIPPTVTHQEKQVKVVNGKPIFYEPAELKAARAKLEAYLAQHTPDEKYTCPIELVSTWCFPVKGKHKNGEPMTNKPDTDNLVKLLKDCMTKVGFWKDDAQVTRDIIEKYWADIPGIYVRITRLD